MKRSLKTLVACAAFTICMCATMIVSFAATDLKIDPVALMAYSQDAASEDGASLTGAELFIGLDTGSYTFADVADSLNDYGLAYEVTDDAYVIGGAVEIGTAGAFTDALAADASYKYNVVGDGSQAVIVTIAAKNAEEVVSVASDIAENELPDDVTDTITDIYNNLADIVPGVISDIQEQAPTIIAGVVDDVTENYSDVIDQASEILSGISSEDVQDFIDNTASDIVDTVGNVADAISDAASQINFDDLWAFLFS